MESQQPQVESGPVNDTESLVRDWEQRRAEQGLPPLKDREDNFTRRIRESRERIDAIPPPTPEQIAREEARHAAELEREAQARVAALVLQAGERYVKCRLSTFNVTTSQQTKIIAALKDYVVRVNRSEGLVLYGPCGTGKDHLAFAIAGKEAWNGTEVVWLNGQDWFGQVRDAMDGDTTEVSLVNRLARPAMAVISDPLPPVGNLTPHQATMLYRVVQARYQAGKPTIVTVNVSSDAEADERLGVPTWDRLCDGAWKFFCNWPSHRKPAREVT